MPGATPAVLEVAGIDVRFEGVVALDGVSLTVRANQIVGVIGPNGAGKTTLFNAVSRFVTPVAGTIAYRGQSLLGLPSWRLAHLGIARTLQGLGLWPTLTVLENVIAGAPRALAWSRTCWRFPTQIAAPGCFASRRWRIWRSSGFPSVQQRTRVRFLTACRSGSSSLAH